MKSAPLKSSRNKLFAPLLLVICSAILLIAGQTTALGAESFVRLHTDAGEILIAFDSELAPHHVDHFLHLARTGFFKGTSFHRIVPGFVIQGGDPNSKDADPRNDGQGGPRLGDVLTEEEFVYFDKLSLVLSQKGYTSLDDQVNLKAEFSTTAKHRRGVLSMARARTKDSAGSQFFICVADRPDLDGSYTIFGYVLSGMEVVDEIVSAPTTDPNSQTPIQPVRIRQVTIIEDVADLADSEKKAWEEGSNPAREGS